MNERLFVRKILQQYDKDFRGWAFWAKEFWLDKSPSQTKAQFEWSAYVQRSIRKRRLKSFQHTVKPKNWQSSCFVYGSV